MKTGISGAIYCVLFLSLLLSACSGGSELLVRTQARFAVAREEMKRGRFEDAMQTLRSTRPALRNSREKAEYYALYGQCHHAVEEYLQASQCWFRCRVENENRDPDLDYRSLVGMGSAYEHLEQWVTAQRHFDEALKTARTTVQRDAVHMKLVNVMLARKDEDSAREHLGAVRDRSIFGFDDLTEKVGLAPEESVEVRVAKSIASSSDQRARYVLPRSDWKAGPARPSLMVPMGTPWRITLHHSGEDKRAPRGMEAIRRRIRSYQSAHQVGSGWGDIGYHFVLDRDGRIWQGRELRWQGAHGGNDSANRGNVGICVMGNSDLEDPTAAQKAGLELLLLDLMDRFAISVRELKGHGEVRVSHGLSGTDCPGSGLRKYLDRFKRNHSVQRR